MTVFEFPAKEAGAGLSAAGEGTRKGAGGPRTKGGPGVREELKDHMVWAKEFQQDDQDFQRMLKALGEPCSCPGFPCKWHLCAAVV